MNYNRSKISISHYLNHLPIDNCNEATIDKISELSIEKSSNCSKNTCLIFFINFLLALDTSVIIKLLFEILDKLGVIEIHVNKKLDEFLLEAKGHSKQSLKSITELQDLAKAQLHNSMLLGSILAMRSLILKHFNQFNFYKHDIIQEFPNNDIIVEHITDYTHNQYIIQLFNSNNQYNSSIRIKNVFKIHFAAHNRRFKHKLFFIGNKQYAWHGTEKKNISSIITRGLLLPGGSSKNYELNYGPGIYFSSSASKSLKYCKNWIDKSSLQTTTNFLILASVAVGKHCVPAKNGPFPTKGFDSTWAHRLDSHYRDELVVYSEDQVRIDYIVEVEKYRN